MEVVTAIQKSLAVRLTRVGGLGVENGTIKNDAADTAKKFSADREKKREQKVRAHEVAAIAATIHILNKKV